MLPMLPAILVLEDQNRRGQFRLGQVRGRTEWSTKTRSVTLVSVAGKAKLSCFCFRLSPPLLTLLPTVASCTPAFASASSGVAISKKLSVRCAPVDTHAHTHTHTQRCVSCSCAVLECHERVCTIERFIRKFVTIFYNMYRQRSSARRLRLSRPQAMAGRRSQ
jgi:hypothetical protein